MNKLILLVALFASVSAIQMQDTPYTAKKYADSESDTQIDGTHADALAKAAAAAAAKNALLKHNDDLSTTNTFEYKTAMTAPAAAPKAKA